MRTNNVAPKPTKSNEDLQRCVDDIAAIRNYLEAFHEAEADERWTQIMTAVDVLVAQGRDGPAIYAGLRVGIEAFQVHRIRMSHAKSGRKTLRDWQGARRDVKRAIQSVATWYGEAAGEEVAQLRPLRELLLDLERWPFERTTEEELRRLAARALKRGNLRPYRTLAKERLLALKVPIDECKGLLQKLGF